MKTVLLCTFFMKDHFYNRALPSLPRLPLRHTYSLVFLRIYIFLKFTTFVIHFVLVGRNCQAHLQCQRKYIRARFFRYLCILGYTKCSDRIMEVLIPAQRTDMRGHREVTLPKSLDHQGIWRNGLRHESIFVLKDKWVFRRRQEKPMKK